MPAWKTLIGSARFLRIAQVLFSVGFPCIASPCSSPLCDFIMRGRHLPRCTSFDTYVADWYESSFCWHNAYSSSFCVLGRKKKTATTPLSVITVFSVQYYVVFRSFVWEEDGGDCVKTHLPLCPLCSTLNTGLFYRILRVRSTCGLRKKARYFVHLFNKCYAFCKISNISQIVSPHPLL